MVVYTVQYYYCGRDGFVKRKTKKTRATDGVTLWVSLRQFTTAFRCRASRSSWSGRRSRAGKQATATAAAASCMLVGGRPLSFICSLHKTCLLQRSIAVIIINMSEEEETKTTEETVPAVEEAAAEEAGETGGDDEPAKEEESTAHFEPVVSRRQQCSHNSRQGHNGRQEFL